MRCVLHTLVLTGVLGLGVSLMGERYAWAQKSPGVDEQRVPSVTLPVAETDVESESPHHHAHRGFYAGLKLGGGYRSYTGSGYKDAPVEGWSATGGGVGLVVSIGGAVLENLVLHADLVTSLATNPTLTVGDKEPVETEDAGSRLTGFGGGATYFFMPLNVYVSGSVLASSINIEQDGATLGRTELGIGGMLQAGKQFWIGSEWAVDVGPSFHLATMSDSAGGGRIVGWAANLLAGVSYN